MADVLSASAVESVSWLTRLGDERGAEMTGARFLWPDAPGGPGFPCNCSELRKTERLNSDGGGFSTTMSCTVRLDTNHFTDGLPVANQACKVKTRPSHAYRDMKVVSVNEPPGEGVIELELDSLHENA